jgi:hypothetical protein
MSRNYPSLNEESEDVQNCGLESLQRLRQLMIRESSDKPTDYIYIDELESLVLFDGFCIKPGCKKCLEIKIFNGNCGHRIDR